ncbi:MAG: calcium-binding protein [Fuerstiella sp.]
MSRRFPKSVGVWSRFRRTHRELRRQHGCHRPALFMCQAMESLENRTLLASAGLTMDAVARTDVEAADVCEYAPEPTFSVDGSGVVRVGGTHGNDVIAAYVTSGGLLTVHVNDVMFAVSDSQVTRLEIDAKCGDDLLGVAASVQHPTSVTLGHGNDTAYVLGGPARVSGDGGNDLIVTGLHDDKIGGGDGHDILLGGAGNDAIYGGAGNDGIAGGDGNDLIRGGAGEDILLGDGPNTWPVPIPGDDVSVSEYLSRLGSLSFGHDDINGGPDADRIYSGSGNDLVFGGAGNDRILGRAGHDILVGGAGDDAVSGGHGNDLILGDGPNTVPRLLPFETDVSIRRYLHRVSLVHSGNDTIRGGGGNDLIYAGRGNDRVHGGAGNDVIFGGPGNDILYGGAGDDIIHGGAGNDIINGGDGNDRLFGGDGDDELTGGAGEDLMQGGAGADTFYAIDGEVDTIKYDLLDILFVEGIDNLIAC